MTEKEFFDEKADLVEDILTIKSMRISPGYDLTNKKFLVCVNTNALFSFFTNHTLNDIMEFLNIELYEEYQLRTDINNFNGIVSFPNNYIWFEKFDDCINFINNIIEPKLLIKNFL